MYHNSSEDGSDIPMPVVIASFTYSVYRNLVTLNWVTIYEDHNLGFDIESSVGSENYSTVAHIGGAGTSFFSQHYSHEDRLQAPGTYHYRLKQIDENENYRYYVATLHSSRLTFHI